MGPMSVHTMRSGPIRVSTGLNGFSAGPGCARIPIRQLLLKPVSDPFLQFRAMTWRERNERQSRLALFVVPANLSLSSNWQVGARQGE
jgi:hypothetical protein